MSLFPFRLPKSKINDLFWNLDFSGRQVKVFHGPCQCYGPVGVPLPGGLPIWALGQLWGSAVDGWPARPCLLHLALAPSLWTCLATWTLRWTWSLSAKHLCLLCLGTVGLWLCRWGHPAVLTFSTQPTLLSHPVPDFLSGAVSSIAVPWQLGVRACLQLAMESREPCANFLVIFVML